MKITITLALFFLLTVSAAMPADEILVIQDKDGHILMTNMHTSVKGRARPAAVNAASKSGMKRRSKGFTIPEYILTKIKTLTAQYDLDEKLVIAVARAESSFNPFALSRKGAAGIMQLMPDTARQYKVASRYNVDQNLQGGIQHLKYLYVKYNGSIPLTLAAYNAGEEAVSKYKGIPPYEETKNYVRRVMQYMGLSYSTPSSFRVSQKIYKIVSPDGRILITDQLPSHVEGSVSIFE